jgi:hypothetical protein
MGEGAKQENAINTVISSGILYCYYFFSKDEIASKDRDQNASEASSTVFSRSFQGALR